MPRGSNANQKALKKLDESPFKHIEYHNLLVILCRIPYVEKFDKIRPFFEEVFGKATVETMYITNRAYETHFKIDAIKNVYINFVRKRQRRQFIRELCLRRNRWHAKPKYRRL